MSELSLLVDLMGAVPPGCSYADARWISRREQRLAVRNDALEELTDEHSAGIGVRVRRGGAWGFAATNRVDPRGARRALADALAVAAAQPRVPSRPLAAVGIPAQGHWEGPCARDPFSVSLEDKLHLLHGAQAALAGDPRVVRREASAVFVATEKAFASTEGAACTQRATESGGGCSAVAVGGEDEIQVRSYPNSHGGDVATAGMEHLDGLALTTHAPRVAEEAVALLTAPVCPSGPATVVLGGQQLALQIHESIGHALELDRILLGELSYAGTSWVKPRDPGSLRYGSPALTVTADATLPGGLGSFGFDDEGTPAQRTTLIQDGVLRATLSDRESAAAAGLERSGGCSRAAGFDRQPIVRMTNVSIEPGEGGSLAQLLADTDTGIYLESNRSWSIDDRRLQFRFATEIAREIRGGELGRLYRNGGYSGTTPTFWGSLDAVCSAPEWRLWGLLNCGKGEPGQLMHVSHGAAPARFADVLVGGV